ncbi:uncharacterized protein LOC18428275 [Amborella trichopoda]|nr:uncharacterized protein LOC18428275 [Amborella trichopoda]|eukprot:XP_011621196.1 uncharacterized protein LOC18428275 [Amborella trichopoda]
MGCGASKVDNEETVSRCRERRRLIKQAVRSRHQLASAHSDYLRALRLTASALTQFASGEPMAVSGQTPAIVIPKTGGSVASEKPNSLSHQSSSSLSSSPTFTNSKVPNNLSHPSSLSSPISNPKNPFSFSRASSLSSDPNYHPTPHVNRHPPRRVRTGSNFSGTPSRKNGVSANSEKAPTEKSYNGRFNSLNFSATPSQTSSIWNWEDFYPPSPPGSDYFRQKEAEKNGGFRPENGLSSSPGSDYFRQKEAERNGGFRPENGVFKHEEEEREERCCSEWGSSDEDEEGGGQEEEEQVEEKDEKLGSERSFPASSGTFPAGSGAFPAGSGVFPAGSGVFHAFPGDFPAGSGTFPVGSGTFPESSEHYPASSEHYHMGSDRFPASSDTFPARFLASVAEKSEEKGLEELQVVVRHKDLGEIVRALEEWFDKAADAGKEVSELLETSRAQFEQSFKQLRKTVYHSSSVLSTLSSSWTSKPPLAIRYTLHPDSLLLSSTQTSHCSTLERLLAWEKKLYNEVRVREATKIEHEKKLELLRRQEGKGKDEIKLDKTKSSIKRLHSLIVVATQAVTATSSAIVKIRDDELAPQLVNLCCGLMQMWQAMNRCHEAQNRIVQQVRGLENPPVGTSTSDIHRRATLHLEAAVSSWHSSFSRLTRYHRDYVRALHSWLRLTIAHPELTLAPPSSPAQILDSAPNEASQMYSLCDEWKQVAERVPDTVASEAIKGFAIVVHSIAMRQAEELKCNKRAETAEKELEKKASNLRNIARKFYNSYSLVGVNPGGESDTGGVLDARDPLIEKKAEVDACRRKAEEERAKHVKAIQVTRAMTLNNIQTGLPGVFQAMVGFSGICTEALGTVYQHTGAAK